MRAGLAGFGGRGNNLGGGDPAEMGAGTRAGLPRGSKKRHFLNIPDLTALPTAPAAAGCIAPADRIEGVTGTSLMPSPPSLAYPRPRPPCRHCLIHGPVPTRSLLRCSASSSSPRARSARSRAASRASPRRACAAWLRLRCRLQREKRGGPTAGGGKPMSGLRAPDSTLSFVGPLIR